MRLLQAPQSGEWTRNGPDVDVAGTLLVVGLPVILEHEADGRYSAWVPELPGCASMGDTRDEALANIREAIEPHGVAMRELARPIPELTEKDAP